MQYSLSTLKKETNNWLYLPQRRKLCSLCLKCLYTFSNSVQFANCKFVYFGYNDINRTPRTSPRKRVMCPRGDILLFRGGCPWS